MSCASEPRGRALDAPADPARAKGAIRRIAEELGAHPEALRTWVKKAQVDGGLRPGTTTDEAQRIKELEKEVRELRRANAILNSAPACLSRRSVSARPVDLPVHRLPQEGVLGPGRSARCSLAPESRSPRARDSRSQDPPPISQVVARRDPQGGDIQGPQEPATRCWGPQDARDTQPTRGRRASRCRSRGPVHRRTAHGRPGPARHPPCQVPAHHAQRAARAVPGRPRQKAFQRVQAERAVGRRHSPASGRYPLLRAYVLRVGLRRLRHRCLLAANRGLADHLPANVHRPGPGRPSDGRLEAETSRC